MVAEVEKLAFLAKPFPWDRAPNGIVELVAMAEKPLGEICVDLGIHQNTLTRWMKHPEFKGAVIEKRRDFCEVIAEGYLSQRELRVAKLQKYAAKIDRIVDERIAEAERTMANIPGAKTGMIVHDVKGVGKGDDFQLVDTYTFDRALSAEMREIQKQIAIETGQWQVNLKVEGKVEHDHQHTVTYDLSKFTVEELRMFRELQAKATVGPKLIEATVSDPAKP